MDESVGRTALGGALDTFISVPMEWARNYDAVKEANF